MRNVLHFAAVMWLAAGAIGAAGCGSVFTMSGQWGGGCTAHGGVTPAGEVDYGISFLTHNGEVYCVVISNGGSGGVNGGPPASGRLRAPDGSTVDWTCHTRNGRSGPVTIGSARFELADGAVFLVDLRPQAAPQSSPATAQVKLDTALLQGGPVEQRLDLAAKSHPELAAFVKACRTAK